MVRVCAQSADAAHVQIAVQVCNPLADVLSERRAGLHHAPCVVEAFSRLIARGCYVIDLRRALIVVHEQVKLYNPEHFAVLPHALGINEAEDNRQNGALEKL